jgi:hypothetical protein
MSVLSYCEMALYGISERLLHSKIELYEETTQLCSQFGYHICNADERPTQSVNFCILKRENQMFKSTIHVLLKCKIKSLPEVYTQQPDIHDPIFSYGKLGGTSC